MLIELSNVCQLPKLHVNLISICIFEKEKCELCSMNSFLQIKNGEDDILFESTRDNTLYRLLKSNISTSKSPNKAMIKMYKAVKSATKQKWHKRFIFINNNH